jgi:hypothetical protein
MPTVWGSVERVEDDVVGTSWIQMRTVLPGGVAIRVRASIGHQTTVARGIERVDPSSLREGECVEVTYHQGRNGFMEAETVYVQPDNVAVSRGAGG